MHRPRFGLAAWDEIFWAMNSVTGGPSAGFDQNRIFFGPMIQVRPELRLEPGYILITNALPSSPNLLWTHALTLYAFIEMAP